MQTQILNEANYFSSLLNKLMSGASEKIEDALAKLKLKEIQDFLNAEEMFCKGANLGKKLGPIVKTKGVRFKNLNFFLKFIGNLVNTVGRFNRGIYSCIILTLRKIKSLPGIKRIFNFFKNIFDKIGLTKRFKNLVSKGRNVYVKLGPLQLRLYDVINLAVELIALGLTSYVIYTAVYKKGMAKEAFDLSSVPSNKEIDVTPVLAETVAKLRDAYTVESLIEAPSAIKRRRPDDPIRDEMTLMEKIQAFLVLLRDETIVASAKAIAKVITIGLLLGFLLLSGILLSYVVCKLTSEDSKIRSFYNNVARAILDTLHLKYKDDKDFCKNFAKKETNNSDDNTRKNTNNNSNNNSNNNNNTNNNSNNNTNNNNQQ